MTAWATGKTYASNSAPLEALWKVRLVLDDGWAVLDEANAGGILTPVGHAVRSPEQRDRYVEWTKPLTFEVGKSYRWNGSALTGTGVWDVKCVCLDRDGATVVWQYPDDKAITHKKVSLSSRASYDEVGG
jgi:outer membrane protein assembly factor BamB